ncbi:NUDIX hydrolase [Blastomonas sp.]|uniref:NUDIX hydrolase n=1 Tax=Blastomonas sp. TaxID=1909299 RepID=UPI002605F3B0|nr:NUDIX hydrolase [Blastomonas sp.]MDM7957911.1 NUDIX hydrolase [Blastomonas sp.]
MTETPMTDPEQIVWQGKFITAKTRGKWEYVSRARGISAAVILAVHDGAVILVEQFRVPLGRPCIELPAGLIGDHASGEAPELAAARELEEETGFRAGRIENLGEFYSSPGMVSEAFHLMRAHDLVRVHDGGGVEGENITVHVVPLETLEGFLADKRAHGCGMDVKLLLLLGARMLG